MSRKISKTWGTPVCFTPFCFTYFNFFSFSFCVLFYFCCFFSRETNLDKDFAGQRG
jgi:hypothetical protein